MSSDLLTPVLRGEVCPYCGQVPKLVDSIVIYRQKSYGMMYLCADCNAYVGVHKGTNRALGRLANKELRSAKMDAHHWFDKIAMTDLCKTLLDGSSKHGRSAAYAWLAGKMQMPKEICHIGMMDVEQCRRVVSICQEYLKQYEVY